MKALPLLVILLSCNFQPARRNLTPLSSDLRYDDAFDQYAKKHGLPTPPIQRQPDILSGDDHPTEETPSGFSHCNFDNGRPYRMYEGRMGTMDLCPQRDSSTRLILRSSADQSTNKICVIPTIKDQLGASAPVAYPQCVYLVAQQYVYLHFTTHPQTPPNGAMMMPEHMVLDFMNCINPPDPRNKELICNSFVSSGGYLDFDFRTNE